MFENYKELTIEQSLYIIENRIIVEDIFCNMNKCYVPKHVDIESLINDHALYNSYVFVKHK